MSHMKIIFGCLCLFVVMDGCYNSGYEKVAPLSDNRPQPIPSRGGQSSNPASPTSENSPEWMKKSWKLFTADGRYRIADITDFKIPTAYVKNEYTKLDLEHAMKYPFVIADINNDTDSHDLAVIVVDTTKNEPSRFGMVIFNEPTNKQSSSPPSWLYRDRDLSKTALSQWSGGLLLRNYHDDGAFDQCYVNWDDQTKSYSCDKREWWTAPRK